MQSNHIMSLKKVTYVVKHAHLNQIRQQLLNNNTSPDHDGHSESDESSGHAHRWRQGDDLKAAWKVKEWYNDQHE